MITLERIYLESSILVGVAWPKVSVKMQNILGLAQSLNIEIFLPEPVALELEGQFERDLDSHIEKLKSWLQQRIVGNHDLIKGMLPNKDLLLKTYRSSVKNIIDKFGILQCEQLNSKTIQDFFLMAVNERSPFREKGTGFKDAIIFHSIVEHLQKSPAKSALLASDRDFTKALELENQESINLKIISSLDELDKFLNGLLEEEAQNKLESEKMQLAVKINSLKDDIEKCIISSLQYFEWGMPDGQIIGFDKVNVLPVKIENIHLPINYNEKKSWSFSFDIDVDFDAEILQYDRTELKPRIRTPGEKSPNFMYYGVGGYSTVGYSGIIQMSTIPERKNIAFGTLVEVDAIAEEKLASIKFISAKLKFYLQKSSP